MGEPGSAECEAGPSVLDQPAAEQSSPSLEEALDAAEPDAAPVVIPTDPQELARLKRR